MMAGGESQGRGRARERARDQLSAMLMDVMDNYAPLIDTAEGFKNDMLRRGWSEQAAEAASIAWLVGAIQYTWTAMDAA